MLRVTQAVRSAGFHTVSAASRGVAGAAVQPLLNQGTVSAVSYITLTRDGIYIEYQSVCVCI